MDMTNEHVQIGPGPTGNSMKFINSFNFTTLKVQTHFGILEK